MSCLFNSIFELLQEYLPKHTKNTHIRKIVCKYIKDNLYEEIADETIENWIKIVLDNEFNISSTDIVDKYIEIIEKQDQWGGGPELSIISKCFNVIIKVRHESNIIATFNCTENPSFILVLDWTGDHYEPYQKLVI